MSQWGKKKESERARWTTSGGGKELKKRKIMGRGEAFQQVVCVCQIIKLYAWYGVAPHQQQTLQLSLKHDKSTPRLSYNSFGLHVNHHYRPLKFANNSQLHMGPIDQIKVNSQTSPIEASSPPMSNGHTRGDLRRPAFLIERSPTVARGEEGNDL